MGRVTDAGIRGMVGPVVFYVVDGKSYVKAKPRKRKRKRGEAPDPLETIFGTVSTYGSAMIQRMKNSFLFPFGRGTYNSLRGWMRNQYAQNYLEPVWDIASNSGMCQVNAGIDLRDFLKTSIAISDKGSAGIGLSFPPVNPGKDLKVPPRTTKVNLKLIMVSSPFRESESSTGFCMEQYPFEYSDTLIPAREFILDTHAVAGDIAIVVIAIEYQISGSDFYSNDPRWLPAAVVAMGRIKK